MKEAADASIPAILGLWAVHRACACAAVEDRRGAGARAELVVLHVLTRPVMYAAPEVPGSLWGDLLEKNRASAKQEIRQIAAELKASKIRVHTVLADGVAFDQILRVARRLRCDLIVIATHGRTGLSHVLMGSVAENVVRRAPCPVLTVRPPKLKP